MSENRGKAKVKSKSKSIAKNAGKNKAAVMNSRDPKKPMAISGDTMSNYAMYKAGGKVTKIKKYQAKNSQVDLKDDLSISNNVQSFFQNPSPKNAVRVAMKINPITQVARAAAEGITGIGAALGNEKMKKQAAERDSIYNANKEALERQKKGGRVKRYKAGGTTKSKFAALAPPYNKATAADRIAGAKKNSRKK